jgi:hypothetical protein
MGAKLHNQSKSLSDKGFIGQACEGCKYVFFSPRRPTQFIRDSLVKYLCLTRRGHMNKYFKK